MRAAVAEAGYAALVVAGRGVISQYGYLEYVAGYSPVVRAAYAVVGTEGAPTLIVATGADAYYARSRSGLDDVRVAGQGDVMSGYDDLAAGVAAALSERGAARGRIGVVGLRHIVPVAEYQSLCSRLPEAEFSDATALLAEIKAIKTAEDIAALEEAAAIADAGLEVCLASLRPGVSGWELCGAIEQAVRARGARGEVLVFLSAGPYFLARPDAQPFASGDLVTAYVELTGPTGAWVEKAALVALGKIDAARGVLAVAILEAAAAAELELRVGRTAGEVAGAIDEHCARNALVSGIWHGHGVGIDHDLPVITATDSTALEDGMVVSVHPNFATSDQAVGASVADTYVIGSGPPRRLSRIPQELHRR